MKFLGEANLKSKAEETISNTKATIPSDLR